MKILKCSCLLILISFYACEEEAKYMQLDLTEIAPCGAELIYVDSARASQKVLQANEIPIKVRTFIATDFPGVSIIEAKDFTTTNQQDFTEVKVSDFGYLLFDDMGNYRCSISRYPNVVIDNGTIDTAITAVEESGSCEAEIVSFKFQIHPILVSNCAQSGCHNATDKEDGIAVETYEQVIEEVRAGDAARSEHYRSITRNPNHRKFMPERPRDPLLESEIQLIGDWINQGAENTDCILPCNSTATSFAKDIQPLFKLYCYGCHQANDKEGGVSMEDYDHILALVADGSLLGSIKYDPKYVAMPLYLDKMTDCQIAQVENWIKEGAQNN